MNKYNKLILQETTTLNEAVSLLDMNGSFGLPVVNSNNHLIGLITDYDLRKAVLNNNITLNSIINKDPFVLKNTMNKSEMIQMLKAHHRRHAPVVNEKGGFVDFICIDEIQNRPSRVVIMAGGLGSRLGELTTNTPKPMLMVGSKPMLEHIIDTFVFYGFTKFMLSVNYKAEVIKEYFKDGSEFGIEVEYLEEKKRLGTGGALSLINIELNEPFFVVNGDVMSYLDYEKILDFHIKQQASATMCIRKDSFQIPYGVIEIDNKNNLTEIKEKPIKEFFINTGIYVLSPEVLSYIPKDEFFDLPHLFNMLINDKKITKCFETTDYWIDMGKPSDYETINKKISSFFD